MANAIYPKWKEALLQSLSNAALNAGNVKAALVDTDTYTYSAAHEFYSSLSGVVGTPQTILTPSYFDGVFDGQNVTYTGLTGPTIEAIVIWIDTGVAGTSRLVAYIDTGVTGLPVTPNGGDIETAWNASGIFQL
jgi:hypothetical protein